MPDSPPQDAFSGHVASTAVPGDRRVEQKAPVHAVHRVHIVHALPVPQMAIDAGRRDRK